MAIDMEVNKKISIQDMESYVQCPACGASLPVILERDEVSPITEVINSMLGTDDVNSFFKARGLRCSCGKEVHVTLTVSASSPEEDRRLPFKVPLFGGFVPF